MRSNVDSSVTPMAAEPLPDPRAGVDEPMPGGVWTLAGDRLIIADRDGPATVLAPTEAVRLLAVDLPIANRAKRLAALPFAIEDRIAEPLEAVHLAIGAELAPRRYLVGVVAHTTMEAWVERIEAAGLGQAALVPDALALPAPAQENGWSVELGGGRALVRTADGVGLAVAEGLLATAWAAAGRPAVTSYGERVPDALAGNAVEAAAEPMAERLLLPALDLRQGRYARRRAALPRVARRLLMLGGLAVAAHALIAAADLLMLRAIADRRADETMVLIAQAAPGTNVSGDLETVVADLLPSAGGPPSIFLPTLARLSAALAPLAGSITAQSISFAGNTLTMELDATEPGLARRVRALLDAGGATATVAEAPGVVRIEARAS